jgi:glycosyltransferase involved in cell wall biosynthesis
MRILFCNFEYPPLGGGGGVINHQLAQELAKRHDVTVLTSQAMGLPRESIEQGVRVVRAPVFFRRKEASANLLSMLMFLPMGVWFGRKLMASNPFDIINTHFVLPTGPVGDAIAQFSGLPNVLSLHGGDLYDPSKATSPHRHAVLRWQARALLRRATILVGQSSNTIGNMKRYYTPELEAQCIPLGIQRPKVEIGNRAEFGLSNDSVLLVTVGRLVARKGLSQLIALMQRFRETNAKLIILGGGPMEKTWKREAKELGVDEDVIFLGQVSDHDKFKVLGMSDLYVSTSQHEGFGLVFLEAMACGLPIICYNHGGQTDFLSDGITGHLVELNDVKQFETRCEVVMRDKRIRQVMGQENLRRVEEYFIDRCAQRYEKVFEQAIRQFKSGLSNGVSSRP